MLYLSVIVLLPLAALTSQAFEDGLGTFWTQVTSPQAVRSLELTVVASLIVVAINAVFGTIIAWLLVRDEFPGKSAVNAVIDLPFALPTIVASLILIDALRSPTARLASTSLSPKPRSSSPCSSSPCPSSSARCSRC